MVFDSQDSALSKMLLDIKHSSHTCVEIPSVLKQLAAYNTTAHLRLKHLNSVGENSEEISA